MLKQLVEALRDDPLLVPEFAANQGPMYTRFNVPAQQRQLVEDWDEPKLILLLGMGLFQVLQAALDRAGTLHYPGFATLVVKSIDVAPAGGGNVELKVFFRWDHTGVPEMGLPAWFLVRVLDANGVEIQPDVHYRVPNLLDLNHRKGEVRTLIVKPPAGNYSVALETAHPELRPSAPFPVIL